MRLKTLSEAQKSLPELVKQAQEEAIGLTDENGHLVGLLAGVSEEDFDELLGRTPAFHAMIARSRASLESSHPVSAGALLAESQARLDADAQQRSTG
jgi:hypothetical protein